MWVEEASKSEGRAVMARIGLRDPHRKVADLVKAAFSNWKQISSAAPLYRYHAWSNRAAPLPRKVGGGAHPQEPPN